MAQSELGLAFFDGELRFRQINEALARINRLPVEAHLGRRLDELFGSAAAETQSLIRQVRDTGQPLSDLELAYPVPGQAGSQRTYRASYWPVRDGEQRLLGVGAMVVDITPNKEAEREREELLRRELRLTDRLGRLQRVSSALAGASSVRDVAEVLVMSSASAMEMERGWVSLLSPDGRTLDWVASVGFSGVYRQRFERLSPGMHAPGPDVMRSQRPLYFANAREQARAYPDLAEVYRAAGNQAGAMVPIVGSDRALGVLGLASAASRRFELGDRRLLEAIAQQCAQALERAFLYDRERETARALTHSLLPEQLPEIPGVELACRYVPTPLLHSGVGGDFYDVFSVGEAQWLLVVGDVCGKGPAAAALTSLVRYTLRAEARHDSSPSSLLSAVGEALVTQREGDRFCTVVCARLDLREPGRPVLEISSAGHPPALLVDADGRAEILEARGSVLGLPGGAAPSLERRTLARGSVLALYTDGLLDAGAPAREVEVEDLRGVLEGPGRSAAGYAAALFEFGVGGAGARQRDDVAMLVLRVT